MITRYTSGCFFFALSVGSLVLVVFRQSLLPTQRPVKFILKRKPVCSVDVIRKYCLEHNYFPTGGKWLNSSYFPDLCRFPSNGMNKERMCECLTRRNVTKIIVLGDSNGLRYFRATKKVLGKFLKCHSVSWTGRLTEYIERPNGMTPSSPTGCRHFVRHKTSMN